MGAKVRRKTLVMGMLFGMVVGLALLVVGPAAQVEALGPRARQALVVVYNAGAKDVDVTVQMRGYRGPLAQDLQPDEAALVLLPAGRAKFEVVGAGAGLARWQQARDELVAGHAYCLIVDGKGRPELADQSRQLLAERNPAKACTNLGRR